MSQRIQFRRFSADVISFLGNGFSATGNAVWIFSSTKGATYLKGEGGGIIMSVRVWDGKHGRAKVAAGGRKAKSGQIYYCERGLWMADTHRLWSLNTYPGTQTDTSVGAKRRFILKEMTYRQNHHHLGLNKTRSCSFFISLSDLCSLFLLFRPLALFSTGEPMSLCSFLDAAHLALFKGGTRCAVQKMRDAVPLLASQYL